MPPTCTPQEIIDKKTKKKRQSGREGLGRSRGGLSTKIHLECDGLARPLSFVLSEGQRGDSCFLEAVVDKVRVPHPGKVVGKVGRGRPVQRRGRTRLDKGYDGPVCRKALRKRGLSHLIPV